MSTRCVRPAGHRGATFAARAESWGSAGREPLRRAVEASPSVPGMRAVQITEFGGPEVMNVVDLPDPVPADGEQLFDVSAAGINYADTHHRLSRN